MALALFDFDGTIISGDSDSKWNIFLIDEGLIDGDRYYARNQKFYEEYVAGSLDIYQYQQFSLEALSPHTLTKLQSYKKKFYESLIKPMVKKQALDVINFHRERGDEVVVITATSKFVVDYSCEQLGIKHVIACEPEVKDDRFTGKLLETPSFREGKFKRLLEWKSVNAAKEKLEDAYYYGDSVNDLFVLEKVGNPVVVDGDAQIIKLANTSNWKVVNWN